MEPPTETVSFDGRALRLDTSEDAEIICAELMGKDVGVLILQGNTFGIEAAERVGLELAKQPYLREAHFKDLFTSRGREEVPEALSHLLKGINESGAQLTLLDLSDNAIGPIGAPSVIEFLESTSSETLEKFYLNNCGLGPEGSTSIANFLPNLTKLREFICGRNRLENKGATSMSMALKEIQSIEVLKFNQNGIRVEGITKLAEAFIVHQNSLRVLDLSDNTIKAEGSTALAKFVKSAAKLDILHLDDSLLENDGFMIIADALSKCPNRFSMSEATFEGNELSGQKIVDTIKSSFRDYKPEFTLNLLENEFSPEELTGLVHHDKFEILVDDVYSDDDDDQGNDSHPAPNGHKYRIKEEGELDDSDEDDEDANENGSENSNGYIDFGNIKSDLREVTQDFVTVITAQPFDAEKVNSTFIQLISTGMRPSGDEQYQSVQILCEELGLIKCEQTRKKKALAREAVIYIGKRSSELPKTFRDFFEVVVKNNDDLHCGKLLFEKLEI